MKKAIRITLIAIGAFCTAFTILYVAAQTRVFPRMETARYRLAVEKAKTQLPAQIDTIRPYSMTARRGDILDCNGKVMARETTVYDINFDATIWNGDDWDEKVAELSSGLAEIIGDKSYEDYCDYINKGRYNGHRFLTIGRNVDSLSMEKLKALPFFDLKPAVGGMIVSPKATRIYPYGTLARRTIGFVRQGSLPYNTHVGIEGSCDSLLTGSDGYVVIKSKWKKMPFHPAKLKKKEIARKEPVRGTDIQTTLDIAIQEKAESVLYSHIADNPEIKGACLVLADVKTGAIRSMANLVRDQEEYFKEYFNVAIGYPYEPGQILSPAVDIAALKCGADGFSVDAIRGEREQTFTDTLRSIVRGGEWNRDSWDIMGLRKVECVSPSDPYWSRTSLETLGKGYCIMATAFDYLSLYNSIARGGEGVRLSLIEGRPMHTYPVCSNEKACTLKSALAESGSKIPAFHEMKHSVAGLTGSSFLTFSNGRYCTDDGEKAIQTTFAGFFPADVPQYSVICMVYSRPSHKYTSVTGIPAEVAVNLINVLYE